MTSIYDIPYADIEIFLRANDKKLTKIKDDDYENAFTLLKDKNSKGHTTSIIEWMIAHNLLISKINIPIYNIDEINNMSQNEIDNLAKLLKMKKNNKSNIINILKYLNKIDKKEFLLPEIKNEIFNKLKELEERYKYPNIEI